MNFAAVEVKVGEDANQAVGRLMHLAHDQGLVFKLLEVFSTFTLNRTKFVRFRSDLDISLVRDALLQEGRGLVWLPKGAVLYQVLFPNAIGTYSLSAMHATARVTESRKYRGTRDKFWNRQFNL